MCNAGERARSGSETTAFGDGFGCSTAADHEPDAPLLRSIPQVLPYREHLERERERERDHSSILIIFYNITPIGWCVIRSCVVYHPPGHTDGAPPQRWRKVMFTGYLGLIVIDL